MQGHPSSATSAQQWQALVSTPALMLSGQTNDGRNFPVSIRAYGAQAAFKLVSLQRIDKYTRSARTFHALNRRVSKFYLLAVYSFDSSSWIGVRLNVLGAAFASALAAYLVYGDHHYSPANIGFSLNMAGEQSCSNSRTTTDVAFEVAFSGIILFWIRVMNDFEVDCEDVLICSDCNY